jgi:hypothetical protein
MSPVHASAPTIDEITIDAELLAPKAHQELR